MIRRDGIRISGQRANNADIAKENEAIYKAGSYAGIEIGEKLHAAIEGTVLYKDGNVDLPAISQSAAIIEVANRKVSTTAPRFLEAGKNHIAVLNFANARNQGGGYLHGATAQEEDLCRASGLYPCLLRKPMFYNANILGQNSLYTDGIIYSPAVPFFRDEHNAFLPEPFELSIITSPAPNLSEWGLAEYPATYLTTDLIRETLITRGRKILRVAAMHGHRNLILGAWGCGAFANDPEMVATVFRDLIKEIPVFEHIVFAVYDKGNPANLFKTFHEILMQ